MSYWFIRYCSNHARYHEMSTVPVLRARFESFFKTLYTFCHSQWIREAEINQLPQPPCEIPETIICVRIRREEGEKTVICNSCGFQRGVRVSTPPPVIVGEDVNTVVFPLSTTTCSKSVLLEGNLDAPRVTPSSNPDQTRVDVR